VLTFARQTKNFKPRKKQAVSMPAWNQRKTGIEHDESLKKTVFPFSCKNTKIKSIFLSNVNASSSLA
jgi:hypothetical protein